MKIFIKFKQYFFDRKIKRQSENNEVQKIIYLHEVTTQIKKETKILEEKKCMPEYFKRFHEGRLSVLVEIRKMLSKENKPISQVLNCQSCKHLNKENNYCSIIDQFNEVEFGCVNYSRMQIKSNQNEH